MSRYVLVPGTHATLRDEDTKQQWWEPGSPFTLFLAMHGLVPAKARPFIWSSNLDGLRVWPWQWFRTDNHIDWKAAAHHLIDHLDGDEVAVIVHSHGLQVALYAASLGLKIPTLVSVMSPVRGDMEKVAWKARPNIARWLHIHSDWSDKMQVWGGLFDGQWGVHRAHPLADTNLPLPKVGHSSILYPDNMALWKTEGLIDFLKGSHAEVARRPA